jgi:hypothetical protein
MGRVLWQFQRAVNLLYRWSLEGRQPAWIAQILDAGKPPELLAWQRHAVFKNQMPRVLRPDLLLTEDGWKISELDSVPGGIGLTQWLNATYSSLGDPVIGGETGMKDGFSALFGKAPRVHVIVSEESASYRPEMTWLCQQIDPARFTVRGPDFTDFQEGDGVYRFFELFDLDAVPAGAVIFQRAAEKRLFVTPPPRPVFEEKLLFALLWNHNLRGFWHQELGGGFFEKLRQWVPYTWLIDPEPLPPQGAYPRLDLTHWQQLKGLSQRDRHLILKVSGFSPMGWGARGVFLGSDLSTADWSVAIDQALQSWPDNPFILQSYHKPRLVEACHMVEGHSHPISMPGRARLCPYYFVVGDGDVATPKMGGILATVCPADKKIIHGMTEAILAPVMPSVDGSIGIQGGDPLVP